jgi:putative transposase
MAGLTGRSLRRNCSATQRLAVARAAEKGRRKRGHRTLRLPTQPVRKRGHRTLRLPTHARTPIMDRMPRTARACPGGYCYHVLNRGNGRRTVFHKHGDYAAFLTLLRDAGARTPVRLLAYCLMPNHFHLALWPREDGDLSDYLMWLMTAHVRRYHQHYHSSGHVWQGRFRAFPIQEDDHLLTVLRYIERNPLRAGLVERAELWAWSSAAPAQPGDPLLDPGPVPRPAAWLAHVNEPQTEAEVERLRQCLGRGRPFGDSAWTVQTAGRLGLAASLRPRGRPRKDTSAAPSLFDLGHSEA